MKSDACLTYLLLSLSLIPSQAFLMVMKSYEPAEPILNIPVLVTYTFLNAGTLRLNIDSFYDYTFFQSTFDLASCKLPKLEKAWQNDTGLEPGQVKTLIVKQRIVKAGTFQDLPAKLVYRLVKDGTERVSWSTTNGKIPVKLERPKVKRVRRLDLKNASWFAGFAVLNILVPLVRLQLIKIKFFSYRSGGRKGS